MRAPSLGGRLADVPLPELLQFLSSGQKSGRLSLSRREDEGLVLFREGQIVYAASSSVRESFGSIVVGRGLISEATLMEALERQHAPGEERRLGAILVEMGRVKPDDLREAMRQQLGDVLLELARWPSGFFRFEAGPVPGPGEVEVDARELLVAEGVGTERVLLELMSRLDEQPVEEAEPAREISLDLHAPSLRGEIMGALTRCAEHVMRRGVLFVVRGDRLEGIAHFGAEGRGPSLPLGEPSWFADAVQGRVPLRGPLPPGPVHDALRQHLGGLPREVLLIPVVLASHVALVFYGEDPTGPADGLEDLLAEMGLRMEKEALEERIRAFERSRHRS